MVQIHGLVERETEVFQRPGKPLWAWTFGKCGFECMVNDSLQHLATRRSIHSSANTANN